MTSLPPLKTIFKLTASAGLALATPPATTTLSDREKREAYEALINSLPDHVTDFKDQRPQVVQELSDSVNFLKLTCPPIAKINIRHSWNLSNWMNKNISDDDWAKSPYAFRMAAFKTTAMLKNSAVKWELLGKLYNNIPSHPLFIQWLDEKKLELHNRINNDEFISHEQKHWRDVLKDEARLKKYIEHISHITQNTFLPNSYKPAPMQIRFYNADNGVMGSYNRHINVYDYNLFFMNYKRGDERTIERTVIHENFHAVQAQILNWYLNGNFENKQSLAFNDIGNKYFYSYNHTLAYVESQKNIDSYAKNFIERAARYVAEAAFDKDKMDLTSLRDKKWGEENLNGRSEIENPLRGILPRACTLGR